MLTPEERKTMIAKIKNLPTELENVVKNLNDAQLDTPYREGGWTARQVVHHLADSHMNAYIRMKLILTEENPTLKPYNQDDWATLPDSKLPIDCSLAIIKGIHERWVVLLNSVPENGWDKSATHPETGKYLLEQLLKIYSNHGEKHVGHIKQIRA